MWQDYNCILSRRTKAYEVKFVLAIGLEIGTIGVPCSCSIESRTEAMKTESIEFRSKSERARDVDLERNYHQIGIPAIAAASQCCRTRKQAKAETEKMLSDELPAAS